MPSTKDLSAVVGGLAGFRRNVFERAAQIVGEGQHVAGKRGHAIGLGVGDFLLRAAAKVFHFGQRAQHLVLEAGVLGDQGLHGRGVALGLALGRSRIRGRPRSGTSSVCEGFSFCGLLPSFIIQPFGFAERSACISGRTPQKSSFSLGVEHIHQIAANRSLARRIDDLGARKIGDIEGVHRLFAEGHDMRRGDVEVELRQGRSSDR